MRAYKDDQDRESLKPKAHEYTQSGTDDQAAQTDAAFNPNKTSPESAKDSAGAGSGSGGDNPLDVSPADKKSAKAGAGSAEDTAKGGAATGDKKASGHGSPEKKGKV